MILFATIMVLAAALAPALAHRRDLRRSRVDSASVQPAE